MDDGWGNVTYNLFQNNTYYAIIVDNGDYLNIHHNRFIDNNLSKLFGDSQAVDRESDNNLWYDPISKEGNHWSDHQSGKPYKIGEGSAVDRYPLDSNMVRIPRNWTELIIGIVLGTSLVAVLAWMAYPKIEARRQIAKKRQQRRKRAAIQLDYDKMVDEEIQKAREKILL